MEVGASLETKRLSLNYLLVVFSFLKNSNRVRDVEEGQSSKSLRSHDLTYMNYSKAHVTMPRPVIINPPSSKS